jgi:hypothetical protein
MTPDQLVHGLARLGREATGEQLTAAEHAGLQQLERSLARRRSRRRWSVRVAACFALAATLSVAVVLWLRGRALTFEVSDGRVSEGGYIVSESGRATVRFSDRSELGIEAGTRLRLSHLDAQGARMMLEGGLLHVSIRPRAQASWAIDAGPYIVRVTGTEFDVSWDTSDQLLELRLRTGKVTVEGSFADGAVHLEAGQRLLANARDGSFSVAALRGKDPLPAPDRAAAAHVPPPHEEASVSSLTRGPGPVPSPAPAVAATVAARPTVSTTPPPPSDAPSWTARAAHGDFQGIVADAERRGVDRALTDAPLGDLAALADAARYARRPDVARRALLAERARFPESVEARDAAFFLGGLAETSADSAGALTWNETYLRESPNGAYASQALGRKMMIVQRLRGTDDARAVAAEYLRRFGDGPYASSARKLLTNP